MSCYRAQLNSLNFWKNIFIQLFFHSNLYVYVKRTKVFVDLNENQYCFHLFLWLEINFSVIQKYLDSKEIIWNTNFWRISNWEKKRIKNVASQHFLFLFFSIWYYLRTAAKEISFWKEIFWFSDNLFKKNNNSVFFN